MTEESQKFAFIVKDRKANISSLVYAEFDEEGITMGTSQDVGDLQYFLTSYVISEYARRLKYDISGTCIAFVNGDKDLIDAYRNFRKTETKDVVRSITRNLVDLVKSYERFCCCKFVEHKEHSELTDEYVPDFEHMSNEAMNKWIHYFLGDDKGGV
jgi:hypothetical protein